MERGLEGPCDIVVALFACLHAFRGPRNEAFVGGSPGGPLFISLMAGAAAFLKMYIFPDEGFVDQERLVHLIRRHGRRGARSPFSFGVIDLRRLIEAFQDPVAGVALHTGGDLR